MNDKELRKRFPASKPCSCSICTSYCKRPGWWIVKQADNVIQKGFAGRIMLEISPEFTFGVLSPAFRGNEKNISLQVFADSGCTFFINELCELHDTDLLPLECAYSYHGHNNLGKKCHDALEKHWNTDAGQQLVLRWLKLTGLFEKDVFLFGKKDESIFETGSLK